MNDSNAPAWNGVRELWNSVHEVLKSVNTEPLVIALVKERFFPSILGFPRPRSKGFKAAVLPYLTARKAASRTEYYKLTYTTGLVIRDDREYRVVSQLPANDKGERVQVLLVTPPGQDTLALKNDLFDRGWDAFYAAHEDFEFYKVADLEKADFNPEAPPPERALMFEHHYDIGLFRKAHMYLPKGQHHGR